MSTESLYPTFSTWTSMLMQTHHYKIMLIHMANFRLKRCFLWRQISRMDKKNPEKVFLWFQITFLIFFFFLAKVVRFPEILVPDGKIWDIFFLIFWHLCYVEIFLSAVFWKGANLKELYKTKKVEEYQKKFCKNKISTDISNLCSLYSLRLF